MEAAAVEIAVAVAGEEATSLLAKVKKHVGYLYHYRDNLKALEEAKGPLEAKRTDGSHFSDDAKRRLKDASASVCQWRSDADELHQKSEKLISKSNISRLNLWSRYSTSKHAWELTQDINKKVESAPYFGTSFDRTIAEGGKFNLLGYMDFESRLWILNEVVDALTNEDVRMCSVCGMGGIGKTTLAKKLVQRVEADRMFDRVAMVTVTQNPNFEEIQKEILESLGLNFDDNTKHGRAKKLNNWLSNNKSLLILDDVWRKICSEDFEDIGIPLGTKVCKIFITSRNLDECVKMGSKPNILLKHLENEEAWDLFVQNAGKCIEEGNLQDTARKIVAECKGLPIAIATIATALKGKPRGAWNDSLKKLRMSNLQGISDMEQVYSKIKVSYDLLNDEEAQSCLRLCCLFPEDYDVHVDKIVFYGWGLELFDGVDSLTEARDRVDSIVHKLKSSCLLLDGENIGCVKLHDIVRDFAIWISSNYENPHLIRCDEEMENWPENFHYEKCHAISFVCQKIKNHPVGLRCPNLKLLHLDLEDGLAVLPNGFLEGMEELRAVDLGVRSPLPPLTMQKALRTLLVSSNLYEMVPPNYFSQILGEGELKNLEIFSISRMSFNEFPVEIGFMRNLRCLRFHTVSVYYMPPGVLSNLVKLEELELPFEFNNWGLQDRAGSRINASLNEIASLPLRSITIGLQKRSILGENIVKSITRFRIFIDYYTIQKIDYDSNVLFVRKVDACDALVNWTSGLLQKCDSLEMSDVDMKHIMSQQYEGNNCYPCSSFSRLKTLKIEGMNGLEEILHGSYLSNGKQACFTNLTKIVIKNCPKLKRLFPLSVVREFTQLQCMKIQYCRELEEIFYEDMADNGTQVEPSKLNVDKAETSKGKQPQRIPTHQSKMEERIEKVGENEAGHVVVLPQLKRLYLFRTPKVRVLYKGNHAIECPSLEEVTFEDCDDMEGLSYGSFNAPRTNKLELNAAGHLKNISKWLPLEQENGILQLKEAKIVECHEMKYLADAIANPNLLKAFFSCLEELCMKNMDSLKGIWHGPYLSNMHSQCFSNLSMINISDCPKVKRLFPLPVAIELKQLQVMKIES